jgi:cytochrome c biogenesis protein CcmG/thiol:disulfide interchange protein DsbE
VPYLEALSHDKSFQLVGINYKDAPADARRFLGRYGNPYAAAGADRSGRESINWGVYGVPETYVIDRSGTIIYKLVGPIDPQNLQAALLPAVQKALAKK